MQIPVYAIFKLWTSVIGPIFAGRGSTGNSEDGSEKPAATSKRQEKLRKRQEKGDPRVKVQSVKG